MSDRKWKWTKIIGPKTFLACLLLSMLWALLPADPHKWFSSARASDSSTGGGSAGRQPHAPPRPGEVRPMSIKELGNFSYDPESKDATIPEDVKALDGMSVRLQGFMIPTDEAEGVSHFALVPSLWSCCYGQPPEVQHVVSVTCTKGMKAPFEVVEIVAEGKLQVQVKRDGGYVTSVFGLACNSIKRVAN